MTRRVRDAVAFLTVLWSPRGGRVEPGRVAPALCWVGPFVEAAVVAAVAAVASGLHRALDSPLIAAAAFVLLLQTVRGFRRVDGFADLAEAGLYRLSHRDATFDELWGIVRSPQNGPYGTAVIACVLLLELAFVARIVTFPIPEAIGALTALMVLAYAAMISAVAAPARVRPASDFMGFAREIARPSRLVTLWLGAIVLAGIAIGTTFGTWWGAPAMLLALVAGAVLSSFVVRRTVLAVLDQLNGDVLGATALTAEIVLLLVATVFLVAR